MHYERTPLLEAMDEEPGGGFAPAPPGFNALMPLPIWSLREQAAKGGCRSIPPVSVEASESALGLLPSIALSSAQSKAGRTPAVGNREASLRRFAKVSDLTLRESGPGEESPSPQGGTQPC